jgi:hypothetical protein
MQETDISRPTSRVEKLSATLTAGLTTPEEKAAAIHRYVRNLYQRFLHRPTTNQIPDQFLESLDQLLEFPDNPHTVFLPVYFAYLEVSLLRVAGLETHAVVLANLNNLPFDPRMVAGAFLPNVAVRVKVGNDWRLSCAVGSRLLAFGEVPWEAEGALGLVATPGTQDFFAVPPTDASASTVVNAGSFVLAADGSLRGDATRTYTGHSAEVVRQQMARLGAEGRRGYVRRMLEREFSPAQIRIHALGGDADPEAPLAVSYAVVWNGYAEQTQDRLIFHPAAFRANAKSPFAEASRHYGFQFPYAWTEQDHAVWTLPAGYQFERPRVPPSIPGDVLSYRISMAMESGTGKVHCDREFASTLTRAKADAAGALKQWYDGVAARDQFELVMRRAQPAAKPDSEAAP